MRVGATCNKSIQAQPRHLSDPQALTGYKGADAIPRRRRVHDKAAIDNAFTRTAAALKRYLGNYKLFSNPTECYRSRCIWNRVLHQASDVGKPQQ